MSDAVSIFVDRIGGSHRVTSVLVGVAALSVIWGFARWGMSPGWVPVATGLPLERVGDATQRLSDAGIDYRLEASGNLVTVSERDVARARVLLASEGLAGNVGDPGLELFDQQSWGMTDFTQRVNYRRAMEGELERTIGRMRGVENARVHIAMRERSFLRAPQQAGEASVVVRLASGLAPDGAVVRGVQHLVASSVEGLEREHVTVLDDGGRLLSDPDEDSGMGMTSVQLRVQTQIEQYLEQKAEAVVTQIVGAANATIRVAADLNFDQIDRTVQALDPNQATLISEDRSEIIPGEDANGAGSLQTNSVFETTRSVETMSRGGARLERLTVAVVVSDRRIEAPDGTVTFQARTPTELRQVETLVANAVGVSSERGDQISVVAAPFEAAALPPMLEESGADLAGIAMALQRPLIAFAGLAAAIFLTLRILGTLKAGPGFRSAPEGGQLGRPEPLTVPASGNAHVLSEAPMSRAPLKVADPEMTARVLRSWMKES